MKKVIFITINDGLMKGIVIKEIDNHCIIKNKFSSNWTIPNCNIYSSIEDVPLEIINYYKSINKYFYK